jgi:DNA invertase Pin-like site-specific DNA recombinase
MNKKVSVYKFCRDFPKQIECLFHLLDELEKISKQNRHNMLLTDEQLDEMLLLYSYKVPHAEIARKFNISYPTVKKYLAISQNRKEKEDQNSGN